MFPTRLFHLFICLCLSFLSASVSAQPAQARATASVDLAQRFKEVEHDPVLAETLRKKGQKITSVCDSCHGLTGNSLQAEVPNMAQQHPVYLLEQLRLFAVGQRKNRFMEGMIKMMTSDEKVGVALFYASQKVQHKAPTNPALVAQGMTYYNKNCVRCHDEDGRGDEKVARVAGQQPVYLRTMLKRYQTTTPANLDPKMAKVIQEMDDSNIESVVAYVMTM